jgi:hypothetical protein
MTDHASQAALTFVARRREQTMKHMERQARRLLTHPKTNNTKTPPPTT